MGAVASPPTARVLDVLELLALEGEWRFTDIVRELDLTQATAHAILGTLGERGWVTRDPSAKTFVLGAAATAFADVLVGAKPLLHQARAAALGLLEETGYPSSVIVRAGSTLEITVFETRRPSGLPTEARGATFPFAAPFGGGFAAWESEGARVAWVERSVAGDADLGSRLLAMLDRSRDRGYELDWSSPALARLAQLAGSLRDDEDESPAIKRVIADLLVETAIAHVEDAGGPSDRAVTTLAAPVFGADGQVVLNLCVHPGRSFTSRQLEKLGRLVARTALSISQNAPGGNAG
ncbi:MAG: helix-turn-helix domain-containing protein [Marmoricola sp.]